MQRISRFYKVLARNCRHPVSCRFVISEKPKIYFITNFREIKTSCPEVSFMTRIVRQKPCGMKVERPELPGGAELPRVTFLFPLKDKGVNMSCEKCSDTV